MTVFFLDNFVDTNGTNLGSHTPDTGTGWTNHPSLNGGAVGAIENNRHYGSVTNSHWFVDDAAPGATADYRVGCQTYVTGFGTATIGNYIYARMDTSVDTGYWFRSYESGSPTGQLQLGKTVSGSATSLGTLSAGYGTHAPLNMELVVEGTTISAFAQIVSSGQWILSDGSTTGTKTACFSVTDSDITAAGRAGLNASNSLSTTRTHFESFFAETLNEEFEEDVEQTLNLLSQLNTLEEEVSEVMTLSSLITFFNVENDREVPENTLELVQSVEVEGLIQSRVSTLALAGVAAAELLGTQLPTNTINFVSTAAAVFGVPHSAPWGLGAVSQELEFESEFSNIQDKVASNTLSFTGEAVASYGFESEISFTQTVSGGIDNLVEQDLGITHAISSSGSEWLRSGTGTLAFTSAGNGWNGNDKCFRRYGQSNGPTATGTLTLYSQDGLYSVVLRNPEVDNLRRTAFDRVLRETRGGNLIVYRDTDWNVVQTLLFTIVALKRSTLDSLQTFFLNTLGEEITLVDWLGEEWSGVVTRPNEVMTEDRDGYWTLPFEFEGTKQEGSSNAQNLGLSGVASAIVESPP